MDDTSHMTKRCLLCLATVYSELLPRIKGPSTSLLGNGAWLSQVRVFAHKTELLHSLKGDTRLLNSLIYVPTDEESFTWSIANDAAGIATASWEYEMERLHFEWLKEDSTNKEEQSIDVDDYISSFHFIHEACFAILLEVLKHPELEGGQMPDYSLLDLMAISSTPSNEIYEEQVPDLLPWPYCDYFLTEAEAWKFSNPMPNSPNFNNRVIDKADPNLEQDPSLKNYLRIRKRVKTSVMPRIRTAKQIRIEEYQREPKLAGTSYTLGLPQYICQEISFSKLWFQEYKSNTLEQFCAFVQDDGTLSGIQLTDPSGLIWRLGDVTKTLGAKFPLDTSNIIGVVLSISKESRLQENLPSIPYENIHGMKLELSNGSISQVLGTWTGEFIRFLRPGKGCKVTGLKGQAILKTGLTNVLLMESNPKKSPQGHKDLAKLYSHSLPLQRLCWPKEKLSHKIITIHKSIGMDLQRYGTSFATMAIFEDTDPLMRIDIHYFTLYSVSTLLCLEFISSSGQKQVVNFNNLDTSIFNVTKIIAFDLDGLHGERLAALELSYLPPTNLPRPSEKRDINYADGDLLDICFHTTLGRASSSIVLDHKFNNEEFGFVLRSPLDQQQVIGLYVDASGGRASFGLLTHV